MHSTPRTALVTGGSRGLGRAIALAFAGAGWRIHATGRNAEALEQLRRDAAARVTAGAERGAELRVFRGDVASTEDNAALAKRMAQEGVRLDAVVHNAGLLGPPRTPLADYPPDDFAQVMAANVFGPFDLTRQLLPHLTADAALLFISSGVSLGPRTGWGAYNVSKIAVDGLAGIWARELRDRGIRVFIVDPGAVRTEMRAAAYPDEDPASIPAPEAIADGIVRLALEGRLEDSGARVEV